jgi:hypothetical protein
MDARGKQAKRRAKADAQSRARIFPRRRAQNIFFSRIVHRKCTEHPQLFNSPSTRLKNLSLAQGRAAIKAKSS